MPGEEVGTSLRPGSMEAPSYRGSQGTVGLGSWPLIFVGHVMNQGGGPG